MRAQLGQPQPAGPLSDPGEASMFGRMSNTAEGRIQVADWGRQMVPNSRHFVMLNQPGASARAVDAFLGE